MITRLVYTQNDLDAPHKFLGRVADKVNEIIANYQKENPIEQQTVVTLDQALAYKRGQINEEQLRAAAKVVEVPVADQR